MSGDARGEGGRGEDLLTIPEASRRLGLEPRGRNLRKLLAAAERRLGRRIGVRLDGPCRSNWRVTEAAARRILDDARGGGDRDALAGQVRAHLRAVAERAESVAREAAREEVAGVRRELGGLIVEVAETLDGVARRVDVLERGRGT